MKFSKNKIYCKVYFLGFARQVSKKGLFCQAWEHEFHAWDHFVEGENELLQVVLRPPSEYCLRHTPPHERTIAQNYM